MRDLLLGRRPKDFDIGTSAHPYQIKRLFRNGWIIGRRFRLAHVIRHQDHRGRDVPAATCQSAERVAARRAPRPATAAPPTEPRASVSAILHRDNTFGTPEEDAFRRDFTINGLFTTSRPSDHRLRRRTRGSQGTRHSIHRGSACEFRQEIPVRMLRAAVSMSSRLGFQRWIPPVERGDRNSIGQLHHSTASPARLVEETTRSCVRGRRSAFRVLGRAAPPGADRAGARRRRRGALGFPRRLDGYRRPFDERAGRADQRHPARQPCWSRWLRLQPPRRPGADGRPRRGQDRFPFGVLPIAKSDVERLRHIVNSYPGCSTLHFSPRAGARRSHLARSPDALTWLEITGTRPEVPSVGASIEARERAWPTDKQRRPSRPDSQKKGEDAAADGRRRRPRRRRRRGREGRREAPPSRASARTRP